MARTQTRSDYPCRQIVQVRRKALLLDLDPRISLSPVELLSALAAFVYGAAIDMLFDLNTFDLYVFIFYLHLF